MKEKLRAAMFFSLIIAWTLAAFYADKLLRISYEFWKIWRM
jgi:hypothetical protein